MYSRNNCCWRCDYSDLQSKLRKRFLVCRDRCRSLATAPADSCWPLGDTNYNTTTYPCDHFGVSTSTAATSVEYNWLFESSPGALVQVVSSVPAPVWNVQPQPPIQPAPVNGVIQAPIPQPPIVAVKIRAPEVDAYHPEFGEPRWVKVTATGAPVRMEVSDLVQNNQVIKDAKKTSSG